MKPLVWAFYDAVDAQQWDRQEAMASPDFIANLGNLPQVSFKIWQQKLRQFYAGFPDGRHRLDFYTVEGDRILTVGHFIGTHRGTFQENAPMGIQIAMKVMHLDRVEGGKIVEHTAQADLPDLLWEIGADATEAPASQPS